VRGAPGELHVASQAQLVPQRHQLVEAVAFADQGEGDVAAVQLVDHDAGGPHHDVHAILRSHDPDVGGQVPAAALLPGVRGAAPQPLRVGAGAHHGDVAGGLAAALDRDLAVGVVGGDHVLRGAVGA